MDADRVPAALADRLGPDATLELVGLLSASERECFEMTITQATDRFERRLIEETSKLRLEMREGFAKVDQSFAKVDQGFGALRQEMAALKFDLLKWSFGFWIAQVAVMSGIVATLFRMTGR